MIIWVLSTVLVGLAWSLLGVALEWYALRPSGSASWVAFHELLTVPF